MLRVEVRFPLQLKFDPESRRRNFLRKTDILFCSSKLLNISWLITKYAAEEFCEIFARKKIVLLKYEL